MRYNVYLKGNIEKETLVLQAGISHWIQEIDFLCFQCTSDFISLILWQVFSLIQIRVTYTEIFKRLNMEYDYKMRTNSSKDIQNNKEASNPGKSNNIFQDFLLLPIVPNNRYNQDLLIRYNSRCTIQTKRKDILL